MPALFYDIEDLQNLSFQLFQSSYKRSYVFFLVPGVISLIAIASLPFINTSISIKAGGIIRPVDERTEVKPVLSGIIDTIFYKEGALIQKNAILLRLKDLTTKSKTAFNETEINRCRQFIHDLQWLTGNEVINEMVLNRIGSPLYKEQAVRFLQQQTEQEASLKKINKEMEMNTPLARDKVISPKEFFDIQIQQEKINAAYKAFKKEQLSIWQQDLVRFKQEISQYQDQLNQVNANAACYEVKAPVTGTIMSVNKHYPGGLLQASETICSISPEGDVIAEAYVPATSIGLIRINGPVHFRIDAFDYNYFGIITGKVIAIDNDYTVLDAKPIFKVRCSLDRRQLHLKNGFTGELRKGLSFQARFITGERSLWQLLFDKMDNWFNPATHE
jgi:HlyD family secretion protein